MTTVSVKTSGEFDVTFGDVANGEWFMCQGVLGVKIDGRGFYPALKHHGNGNTNVPVTRVFAVHIMASTAD